MKNLTTVQARSSPRRIRQALNASLLGVTIFMGIVIVLFALPWNAAAASLEISGGGSYERSNLSGSSYSWNRRYGGTVGWMSENRSGIEFAYQDVLTRTHIDSYEDTTYHDRIYSFNWVQTFTGRDFPLQPFLKAGIGQLNRDASGSYANGVTPAARVDSVTAIIGGGLRIYLTRSFGLRSEITSYLTGARLSTFRDNISVTGGVSFYF